MKILHSDTICSCSHSLRCQSLILLKLYKMKRKEVRECQRAISDYMSKSAPKVTNGKTPSPLSPTNSVCSQVRE